MISNCCSARVQMCQSKEDCICLECKEHCLGIQEEIDKSPLKTTPIFRKPTDPQKTYLVRLIHWAPGPVTSEEYRTIKNLVFEDKMDALDTANLIDCLKKIQNSGMWNLLEQEKKEHEIAHKEIKLILQRYAK